MASATDSRMRRMMATPSSSGIDAYSGHGGYHRQPMYRGSTPPLASARPAQSCALQESQHALAMGRPPSIVGQDRAAPHPGALSHLYSRPAESRVRSDSYSRPLQHPPYHAPSSADHYLPPHHTPSLYAVPPSSSSRRLSASSSSGLHREASFYPHHLYPSYYALNANPPAAKHVYWPPACPHLPVLQHCPPYTSSSSFMTTPSLPNLVSCSFFF
jgi:hypothetical protein